MSALYGGEASPRRRPLIFHGIIYWCRDYQAPIAAVMCCSRPCIWTSVDRGALSRQSRTPFFGFILLTYPGLGKPSVVGSVYRLWLHKYFGG